MRDRREEILARLLDVMRGVEGVLDVGRNVADVPGLTRPAMFLHDAGEEFFDKPGPNLRRSQIQRMQLTPGLTINVGAAPANVGTLLNTLRARLVLAVVNDTELSAAVGGNGEILYHGCEKLPATAEAREGRMEVNFVFTYIFTTADLIE